MKPLLVTFFKLIGPLTRFMKSGACLLIIKNIFALTQFCAVEMRGNELLTACK